MTKKLFIKTYGCQMNVYDSERMHDVLQAEGYETAESVEEADLVVLNTCHIREKAAEKVYSEIGRLRQLKDQRSEDGKDMYIAVAGCVAQAEGKEMMRRAPSVDMVFGPQTYHRLPDMLKNAEEQRKDKKSARVLDTDFPVEAKFDFLPEESESKGPTAFLTIQEGCDKFCTYCVVPYTRGVEFSRPVKDVLDEAQRFVSGGAIEITFLGQNVNNYEGADTAGDTVSLAELIKRAADIEGLERIRYTTSYPRDITDDLIAVHGSIPQLMPYLHLPVQSGSDRILQLMNRKHSVERYCEIVDKLRNVRPDIALSSDFIVGFPGETDEDFDQTMKLVSSIKYAQAYSFKYSPRPGTPAALMEDQVPEAVKSERLQALQAEINRHQIAFNEASIGKRVSVLLERSGKQTSQMIGRSAYMQSVYVDLSDYKLDDKGSAQYTDLMGRLIDVDIIEAGPNSLRGRIIA